MSPAQPTANMMNIRKATTPPGISEMTAALIQTPRRIPYTMEKSNAHRAQKSPLMNITFTTFQ